MQGRSPFPSPFHLGSGGQSVQGLQKTLTDLSVLQGEYCWSWLNNEIEPGCQLWMKAKGLAQQSFEAIAPVGLAQLLTDADAESARLTQIFVYIEDAKELVFIELALLVDVLKVPTRADASRARESERHAARLPSPSWRRQILRDLDAHAVLELVKSLRADPANL